MERFELNLSFLACLLSFSLLTQPVNAAVSTNQASAAIDWGSLSLNFIFGGVATTENEETQVYVHLEDEFGILISDSASSLDWTSSIEADIDYSDSGFSTAISTATGSTTTLSSFSELISSTPSLISSNTYRDSTISATGTNILLLTASYSLLAEVTDSELYEAFSILGFSVAIENSAGEKNFEASAEVYTGVGGGESSSQDSGILALAIPVEAGDILNFSAFAYTEIISNNKPVPVPASFWLLGSAFLVLLKRDS